MMKFKRFMCFIAAAALLSSMGNMTVLASGTSSSGLSGVISEDIEDEEDTGSTDSSEVEDEETGRSESDTGLSDGSEENDYQVLEETEKEDSYPSGDSQYTEGYPQESGMILDGTAGSAAGQFAAHSAELSELPPIEAEVQSLIEDPELCDKLFPDRPEKSVVFEAVLRGEDFEGTAVSAVQMLYDATAGQEDVVKPGDRIYVRLYRGQAGVMRGEFSAYVRWPGLLIVCAAILLLTLLLHARSSIRVLLSLALTGGLLLLLAYPLSSIGISTVWGGAVVLLFMVPVSVLLIYGLKWRTISAVCASWVSIAAGVGFLILLQTVFHLSGITDLVLLLENYRDGFSLDLSSLLLVGAMMMGIGAVIAVSNTASAGAEPKSGEETPKQLFSAGWRNGSAALTPVLSAIVFAGMGLLIPPLLIMREGNVTLGRIFSEESVTAGLCLLAVLILMLLVCIPLSAGWNTFFLKLRKTEDGSYREFHVREKLEKKLNAALGKAGAKLDERLNEEAKSEKP